MVVVGRGGDVGGGGGGGEEELGGEVVDEGFFLPDIKHLLILSPCVLCVYVSV